MKKFNRVLAMVLALITVLAMLPISAIADTWLDVEAEKEQVGNVTTSDVTVTVDPYALLAYLQDGDWVGLLKGMSATGGLGSIMTPDEFFDIVPKEDLVKLVEMILEDVDKDTLLDCFDVNELLTCFDRAALIDLFMGLDNLQSYVRDYDLLMSYVDLADIEAAVAYIDTEALFNDYAEKLIDLALGLEIETLFDIVDLDKVVTLVGFDFAAAADQDYFVTTVANSEKLASYVDLDAIKAKIEGMSYEELEVYVNEANAQVLLQNLLKEVKDLWYPSENREKYWIDVDSKLNLPAVYGDRDALLVDADMEEILLKGYTDGETTYAPGFNLSVILFGDKANGIEPLFTFADLINEEYVNVEKLAADFGYDNLVVFENAKEQIVDGSVSASDVAGCINDYSAALETIGVVNAIEAIGSYQTIINNYVTNENALIATFDLTAIASAIIGDYQINNVFRVVDMVYAVGVKKIAAQVQFKKLGKLIYESGVIETFVGMLDVKEYLIQAFNILAGVQKNVTAIAIDGVVITEQNASGYIQLVPARVIDALENLVPSLGELANIDESGKLLTASIAISYYADETGEVINTKVINFNFALTAGTDMIRKAAAKLSVLLNKVGYADLEGGELVAEITIPSEFATVLRKALEKLADSSDPKMNAIKDKVLAAYNAQPDDFIAFAQGLTFEEVMAVLDAIDPALFGEVYNKALASRYAKVLLAYIERVTGYDLSDNLEAQYLVEAISEIPTFEEFAKQLEEVTDIEFLHLLPGRVNGYLDNTAYDVIEKLASEFGYEFDMENLLKQAAASTDPFAYLYTAVINKVENFGGVYNFVKRNAIRVANRLMATDCGQKLADNCLLDFYQGNSTFVFDQDITFDAKVVFEKTLDRVLARLGNYAPGLASKLDFYVNEFVDIIVSDSTLVHTGFDVTINVKDIYRVEYVNEYGATIATLLLPVGTDLSKMVDNYANVDAFNGWIDVATGEYLTTVPAKDVVVQADIQGFGTHNVTVVLKDSEGNVLPGTATLAVQDGATLDAYLANLNELAVSLYPALTADEATLGYVYNHEFDKSNWNETVEKDITVYATVALDINSQVNIQIGDLVNGVDFTVELTADACIVTLNNNWNEYDALDFSFNKEFVATLGRDLVLTADVANAQKVTLNKDVLAQLVAKAAAHPVAVETIGFSYDEAVATYVNAEAYEVGFNFNGNEEINVGNFTTAIDFVLPFAGLNTDDAKTFVYVNEDLCDVTVAEGTIAFAAEHFSTITIVNKYALTVDPQYKVENAPAGIVLPEALAALAVLENNGVEVKFAEWYAEGEVIEGKFAYNDKTAPVGLKYAKTMFNDTAFDRDADVKFVMPAEAVTVTHYAETTEFTILYYVDGKLETSLTKTYTLLNIPTLAEVITPYNNAAGWYWFDQDSVASKLGTQTVIELYWVSNNETKITVEFYIDNKLATTPFEKSISDWRDGGLANLKTAIDAIVPGYIWKTNDNKQITDLTLSDLVYSDGTIELHGTLDTQEYHVFTDGNATVDVTDAVAGTTITVGAANKPGYTSDIKVYKTEDGMTPGEEVAVVNGKFEMPYSNVIVKVTYKAVESAYEYIEIVVSAGKTLNATDVTTLDSAPADLVLVKAERNENGALVLTYRYSLPATGFNKTTFLKEVKSMIAKSQALTTSYIVDGVVYTSEKEALANLPEGATFAGWVEMSNNVKVAFLEFAETESNAAWLIVCIALIVLLIVALIVLVYVLHISDRLSTSWITKVCTAIVTGFFAFCTFIANVVLKLLKLLGIKKEDIIEELPAEPVEDIPAVIHTSEEATEEVVEETAEEVVEETTEEQN